MLYAMSPDHLYPFIYDGTPPSTWRKIDTSDCVVGRLYVYDENTQAVTPIGDQTVTTFASTQNHLYYVTEDQLIVQADYLGADLVEIYLTNEGDITMINTFGDYLYFIDAENGLIVLNVPNQSVHAMIPGDAIMSAYMFDADKLIWYDKAGNATYYNITNQQSVVLVDENAETELIMPYVAPGETDTSATIQSSTVVNNVGQSDSYNNIGFPLAEYPAIPERKGYEPTNILSYFKDGEGTPLRYALAGQCDGFAKFAHDTFWHIADWSRTKPSWQDSTDTLKDYHGEGFEWDNEEEMIDFFEGLSRGSFVRYTSKRDYAEGAEFGSHSYFFDGIDADGLGMWHYECNQDFDNGIGYQYYTFDLYFIKNEFIYEYVEHTPGEKSTQSTIRHRNGCTNCNGYLVQPHTAIAIYRSHDDTYHQVSFSCCDGYVLERHIILSGAIDRCKRCTWIE